MPKNKLNFLILANIVLIVCFLSLLTFNLFESTKKIAIVDSVKLFEGFRMSQEMKRIGEKEINNRRKALDTIYSRLQMQSIDANQKKLLMQKFIEDKEALEKFSQNFSSEEGQKVWNRIHGYMKQFSEENNYSIVLVSERNTVLFADESMDVTTKALNYLNKKYEGIQ